MSSMDCLMTPITSESVRPALPIGSERFCRTRLAWRNVVELLKVSFQRNRPNAANHPGNFWAGGASFASGHSIESWAFASVISHEYGNHKWVPYLAFGLTTAVSSARFAAQQHYASDVFVGAASGFFIGRYVVNTHDAHTGHLHRAIVPIVQPAARTFGIQIQN